MSSNDSDKWLTEYESFLNSDSEVPSQVSKNTFIRLNSLINPSVWFVFAKVLGIHFVIGVLSLSVCHQFGMNPFGTERSLDNWFMSLWGHSGCMIACGTLFLSASILTAGYILTIEEVRALKRTEFIQSFTLGLVSLGVFAALGAQLAIAVAGLWLLGGLVGGFIATEAVWKLKHI